MGIFDNDVDLFATYRATLTFRDKVMGGTPMDPKIVAAWLRKVLGTDKKEELRQALLRTLLELGMDVNPDMTYEELEAGSEKMVATKQTNGFKRDAAGVYLESRTIKAAIKECTSILYPFQAENSKGKWGATNKAARSYVAERVFVNPDHVSLGRLEPDGVELFIGHTSGPKGPQSNLTYYQYAERATIECEIISAEDGVSLDQWKHIWVLMQENGLGALRSQGFGRFDLEQFERIPTDQKKLKASQEKESEIQKQRELVAV